MDLDVAQRTQVIHTDADPMERLNNPAQFDGKVQPGGRYVLVDDVTTMGSALTELAQYIQARHGGLAGVVVLANAARSGRLMPERRVIRPNFCRQSEREDNKVFKSGSSVNWKMGTSRLHSTMLNSES